MEITYEQWVDTYKPISDKHGQPRMFETYGEDLDIVRVVDNSFLWTFVDGGDYSGLSAGFHFVNRLGYYICQVAYQDEDLYIDLYEPDECEKSGHEFETIERYDGKEYECCKHCGEDKEYLESYDD